MKTKLVLYFMFLIFSLMVSRAQAELLYDTCLYLDIPRFYDVALPVTEVEITQNIVADDFTFTSPQVLTSIRFWADFGDWVNYTGTIHWGIYADNGGSPGDLIAGGLATPTRTYVSTVTDSFEVSYNRYQLNFSLDAPLRLVAGTYWLALHHGPYDNEETGVYWIIPATQKRGENIYFRYDQSPFEGQWIQSGELLDVPLAFALYGSPARVPIPHSLLFLLLDTDN
jgi:hypothetical protein